MSMIVGGLLSGVGQGMVSQAEQRRQEALEKARELRRQQERQEDRQWQQSRDEASRAFSAERDDLSHERALEREQASTETRGGLLSRVDYDEEGNAIGITQSGQVKQLGYRRAPTAGSRGGGAGGGAGADAESEVFAMMSPEEKRTYDEIKDRFTNRLTNVVDYEGLVSHLRSMPNERGGSRWNEIADLLTGDIGASMTEAQAREQAEQEAKQREGWRGEGFPDDNRDAWVEQRARELRGGSGGGSRSAEPTTGQQISSGDAASEYNTADDVKAAYQAKKLTRGQALELLRSQFGYQ